jgi:hypothetical protein
VGWGTLDRDAALAGLAESLRSLATHVGVSRVSVTRCTPRAFCSSLKHLVR